MPVKFDNFISVNTNTIIWQFTLITMLLMKPCESIEFILFNYNFKMQLT